ncbi:MAG: cytochrome P450 [Myxococcales bacterium]
MNTPVASDALPRPPGSWLRAHVQFARAPLEFPLRCAREVGPLVELPMPGMRAVLVSDPESIERVLLREREDYVKDWFTRKLSDVLGQGLLVSEGEFWKRQRRLIQPAFHPRRIAGYAQVMVQEAEALAEELRDGEVRDLHAEMMRLTLRIVARTLFGSEVSAQQAAQVERALAVVTDRYMGVMETGLLLPTWFPSPGMARFRRAMRELDALLMGIVRARRRAQREGAAPGDDLLGMLLSAQDDDGARMTDEQLRDECMTLFLAGHETTALNLAFTLYLLSQHPEAEARLHAELDTAGDGVAAGLEALDALPYTRAVIDESLRLYPPAWAVGREAVRDVELRGHGLPRGTQVWIATYVIHRSAEHFGEPEAFRPERWMDGLRERLPRHVFMPFGGGPRVCIGNRFALAEAALVLATLARRHRFELAQDPALELMPSVTLRPRGGLRMRVRAR